MKIGLLSLPAVASAIVELVAAVFAALGTGPTAAGYIVAIVAVPAAAAAAAVALFAGRAVGLVPVVETEQLSPAV